MHPAAFVILVLCVCLSATVASGSVSSEEPEIIELYPNPVAHYDRGEFVTVHVPAGTNLSAYELSDGHVSVPLSHPPNVSRSDDSLITLSTDVERTASLTNRTLGPLSDRLQMANAGDSIRLIRNGTVVDEVAYERAPEGHVYDVEAETWDPLGATDKEVISARGGTVEAFVLPDEPDRAVTFLEGATDRILLGGYTLSSNDVVDALIDAHDRGVTVEILVDGSPVGGMSGSEAAALDELSRAGVSVQVLSGELERYRFHHAKYAVVDGRALVTTENWKPSGTGGKSSRGWGVITSQERVVDGLVETHRADTGWVDTTSWTEFDDVTLVDSESAEGGHPSNFESTTLPVNGTQLLVAPDNVEETILETIEGAEDSLDIKQVRISDPGFPFLQAILDAAERGVEVRILLSGEWYVEEENRQLKTWLDEQADAEDLPISVRVAEPDEEFEKIHAKGLIVDGERTFVGSVNWNNNSVRHNREVGLLIDSGAVGEYFETVFESDWQGGSGRHVPLGYVAVCLAGATVAVLAGRQLEFEDK